MVGVRESLGIFISGISSSLVLLIAIHLLDDLLCANLNVAEFHLHGMMHDPEHWISSFELNLPFVVVGKC
jgi:hypothetical protein